MIIEHDEAGRPSHVIGTYSVQLVDLLQAEGRRFIEVVDPDFDVLANGHVENGALRQRPDMGASIDKTQIAADGEDVATISDIPLGASVYIDGVLVEHFGNVLPLSTDMPATYSVDIERWPFLPFTVEIVAI